MYYLLLPSLEARTRLLAHLRAHVILAAFHYQPLHLSDMGRAVRRARRAVPGHRGRGRPAGAPAGVLRSERGRSGARRRDAARASASRPAAQRPHVAGDGVAPGRQRSRRARPAPRSRARRTWAGGAGKAAGSNGTGVTARSGSTPDSTASARATSTQVPWPRVHAVVEPVRHVAGEDGGGGVGQIGHVRRRDRAVGERLHGVAAADGGGDAVEAALGAARHRRGWPPAARSASARAARGSRRAASTARRCCAG